MAYREIILDGEWPYVTMSEIKQVPDSELNAYRAKVTSGSAKCDHRFVQDTPGFAFDVRRCAVCGSFGGLI